MLIAILMFKKDGFKNFGLRKYRRLISCTVYIKSICYNVILSQTF